MLPFPPRVLAKEYLGLNPLGTIPFLIDGDTRMTESAAISHYLVARYGPTPLSVGVDEPEFGAFLNWLHFGEATLTFPQTLVFRYSQLEPEERRNPQIVADYSRWFFGRLRGLEAAVSRSETVCAGRFTAADISVGYALLLARNIGLSSNFPPGVTAYWERLQMRAGSSPRFLPPVASFRTVSAYRTSLSASFRSGAIRHPANRSAPSAAAPSAEIPGSP